MMNPFKTKNLEEFTILDCETYLKNYEYGEHHKEVQKRLEGLINGTIKSPEDVCNKVNNQPEVNGMSKAEVEKGKHIAEVVGDVLNYAKQREKGFQGGGRNIFSSSHAPKVNSSQTNQTAQPTNPGSQKPTTGSSDSDSVGDVILSWIVIIVGAAVAGTIIIYVIGGLLPKENVISQNDAVIFFNKYKYAIYMICLGIGKWIDKQRKS